MLISDRLDGIQAGVAVKAPVRCATTANITLSGEQTIDGVAVSENGSGTAPDRVLVKNQTSSVDNGIYDVSTSGWTRAKDFDGARDVVQGTLVPVYAGTVNGRTTWQCTTANPVRPGTSSLTFEVVTDVDLAADLADTSSTLLGDALAGVERTYSGATATTLHDWIEAQIANPLAETSAAGDNVTLDTTAVQSAINTGAAQLTPATGYLTNTLTVGANSLLRGAGRAAPVKMNGNTRIDIGGSNLVIEDLRLDGFNSDQCFYSPAEYSNIKLINIDASTDATATNGNGISLNFAITDFMVLNSSFITDGYSILFNNGAGGSQGLIFNCLKLSSTNYDAMILNTVSGDSTQDVIFSNSLISASNSGVSASAGFSIAFAQTDGFVISGVISQYSRQEALHLEDGCQNGVVTGFVAKNCYKSGIRIYKTGSTDHSADYKPIPLVGGSLVAQGSIVTGEAGIYIVDDPTHTMEQMVINGYVIDGFDSGLWVSGGVTSSVDNCVVRNCNYAIRCGNGYGPAGYTRIAGKVFVKNTATLVYESISTGVGLRAGKFICEDKPTTIVSRAGSSKPGVTVEGFSWPQPNSHAGGGTEWFTLFAAGTRMLGRFTVQVIDTASAANAVWYSADAHWDGTTLTLSNVLSDVAGAFTIPSPALRVNGGNVQFAVICGSAKTMRIDLNFDGLYTVV